MRNLVFFLFLASCNWALSQDKQGAINVTFDNMPLEKAITVLEDSADTKFYFQREWLKDINVSGNYVNLNLRTILERMLQNTTINFYIMTPNKIILTQNSLIYDELPANFFGKEEKIQVEGETGTSPAITRSLPVLANNAQHLVSNTKTVRVGKENNSSDNDVFTLTGRVLDFADNSPVSDIAITVEGKSMGTSSNADGTYTIELPRGENLLIVRGLGYRNSQTRIIIYNDGNHDFVIEESVEQLNEVVVEGEINKNVRQAITGITTIDVEGIKEIPLVLGERDILKAAIMLPGISNAGEGAAGYNVRGGRTDQNLILLDDSVIYNPAHFFGIFSAINPYSTNSVDIYKGHVPAEFGGRLSSVFDIQTKEANKNEFAGEASIGPVTSNVILEIPIVEDKSSLLIGGRGTYSNWILRSLDNEELSRSTASFVDFIGKYHHAINENNDIQVSGYYSRDEFSITSDSIFDFSNRLVSLKWNHRFNQKNTLSVVAANSEYKFGIGFEGESNTDFDLGYTNNETELKLKFQYVPNASHSFDYGLTSKLYTVDPGFINPEGPDSDVTPLTIPQEKGLESAVFISDSYEVNKKLLFDIGFRYSFYMALGPGTQRIYEDNAPRNNLSLLREEEFGNNETIETYGGPEARISARYFLGPDFSVKASFNNGFQYIHTLSNNTTVSPTDTWKLSDINIEPQQANQFSLGFYKNYEGNTYEISLEGYYKSQKNLLDYKIGAQLLLNENIEQEVLQGDGKAYGVEFLVRKNEGRLNGWLGYTYSRSLVKLDSEFNEERVNNGEFFPSNYDKPHDFSLVANYKFTKRFSASANFVYQTGRPVTFPVGNFAFNNAEFVFFSDRNRFRIPDYYRLDLSFNMEGNHKIKKFAHSFWSFSIYNVLGRNNPYSVFFVTENGEIKSLQSSIFAIPIPTISYNFKF